jgi:hypothetical protein
MISKKTFRYNIFLDVCAKLARGFGSFLKSRDKPRQSIPPARQTIRKKQIIMMHWEIQTARPALGPHYW